MQLSEFNAQVLEVSKQKPVLVDFWAIWCGPCQAMHPVLDEIASELGDQIAIVKIDVDESIELSETYKVRSIPAFKIFRNGEVVEEAVGIQEKTDIVALLQKHI